ncbi:enoyl-CoA hydratase/carnithine racemase [Rhizobium sp. BK650]|uniref:enoyl-CoA hydratase/isomerase family protein n=1 Tax=Rhizobium sp. BK650 TaxID=2586990 RepID=UPI001617DEBD|nr:enoyl-CoA hydratase/isomerase family protein [Rhizobium sp. BK650]MBB3660988.1 enoyl-CoA hydratase/carnithine racemase [Rhizobium sp. BK650]
MGMIRHNVGTTADLMTPQGLLRFSQLLDTLEQDSDCHLLLFEGLGHGRDVGPVVKLDVDIYRKWEQLFDRVRQLPVATIALVDGRCTGLHLELALVVDASIAVEGSTFEIPEIRMGYLPGMSIFRLAKQVGLGAARRLLLKGETWSATSAVNNGLIDEMCEPSQAQQRIVGISQQLTAENITAVRMGRRLLEESFSTSYEDGLGHFFAAQHRCFSVIALSHFGSSTVQEELR